MAERLRPCPFCGNTNPEIVSGDAVCCCTEECWAQNGYDEWQKPRTPGPATAAMLADAERTLHALEESDPEFNRRDNCNPWLSTLLAFLAEWAEPATPPAPETSPWKCCVCGEPVRIGADLRPWHMNGPTSHEAELSDADLKFLADGLRLTD